jgi:hypothetical protein
MFTLYNLIRGGGSSFLLALPAINSFYVSNLIFYKLSLLVLIISSVLCNMYDYNYYLTLFDYFMITIVGVSYINNININIIIGIIFYFEMLLKQNISITKNITFIICILLSCINTKNHCNHLFIPLLAATIIGVLSIVMRNTVYEKYGPNNFTYILTFIWHCCVASVLYITCFTAINGL